MEGNDGLITDDMLLQAIETAAQSIAFAWSGSLSPYFSLFLLILLPLLQNEITIDPADEGSVDSEQRDVANREIITQYGLPARDAGLFLTSSQKKGLRRVGRRVRNGHPKTQMHGMMYSADFNPI
jgi:hypothetical protein